MRSALFPLSLKLTGRRVVVIGGGHVATRRVPALLSAGANVVVVAPQVTPALHSLIREEQVTWLPRPYRRSDLEGAWLVQTATGDPQTDHLVADHAEAEQIWCLKGGDPDSATAWAPAVAHVDDVTVAINAGGDARRAATLRNAIASALEDGSLPLRRHARRPAGRVALVGAGPGGVGLITSRGRQLLAQADVVVIDRLAPREALTWLDDDVEIIDVGKLPGHHQVPQATINALLIERARAGHLVVRLKGGDPFVFGRGGEELLACRAADVPVEVVPGVSSAIAVAAAVGIPVTHRGVSRGFTVLTGHDELSSIPPVEDHTLVLLMGMRRLRAITEELLSAGHPGELPAAVIERGFAADQRLTTGTLADLADRAEACEARAPAIIVIGRAVTALR